MVLALWMTEPCGAYSVLSHEAMIDAAWETALKPALLARFPGSTLQQLKEAHSYAYGGAIIQDEGYYPHGNGYFSDLLHYARSGDFILALISDSQTLDEYAFALGALSHYASDNNGHRLATNVGEPLLYPKLRRKFGNVVTYTDSPYDHLRTEYAFDVEQVVKGNFAPEAYHDFIGFNVPKALLERAFHETYGFELEAMFGNFDKAIGSYRHTLSTLIPFFTRVAWAEHQKEIRRTRPGITHRQFLYVMKRSSYEREWGKQYDKPSPADRIVAFLVKLLPPIGEIKILKFKALTPHVEQLFLGSFTVATKEYGAQLQEVTAHRISLENTNFDVGVITNAGDYNLQDEAYAYWLGQLARRNFDGVTPAAASNIENYYRDLNAPIATKKHPKNWQSVLTELAGLKAARASGRASFGRD